MMIRSAIGGAVIAFAVVGFATAARVTTADPTVATLTAQLEQERADHARELSRLARAARTPARVRQGISAAARTYRVSEVEMRRVAFCESRMNPAAVGRIPVGRERAQGLMQILPSTFARTPYRGLDPFDPAVNALAAAWIVSRDRGWRQWACKP